MAAVGGGEAVQKALQSVAQSTGWTYSLLWRFCPLQGALVWAEGHYNGAIRTRKTTTVHQQPGGEEEEETATAALRRSRQLKELYDSLAAGEAADGGGGAGGGGAQQQQHQHQQAAAPPPRRPAAALAPEDLTETEWFYLMCASYCFPPAIGLPGETFVRRVHVWLCGANKVDSKVFLRAILARNAGIQTVACIPVNDGVLEIGTTEKVDEDICLIQYARGIFMDQIGSHIMPTLSGHSTSTPTTHINNQPFPKMENCIGDVNVQKNSHNPGQEHNDEMENDGDRIDLETNNTENVPSRHSPQDTNVGNEQGTLNAGMMLIGTSERDKFGPWRHFLDKDLSKKYLLQSSAAEDQAVLAENAHYVETVLTVLRFNACRQTQADSNTRTYLALSKNSSFSRWNHKASNVLQSMLIPDEDTPQRMLKSILLGAHGSRRRSYRGDAAVQSPEPRDDDGDGTSRSRSWRAPLLVQPAELSGSHVVKERRRREKLNERFAMLRSLVPFVTKMDRASILGDTIEYVKQLRRRIHDLESRARLVDGISPKTTAVAQPPPATSTETKRGRHDTGGGYYLARAGTGTAAEASGSCCNSSAGEPAAVAGDDTEVQVSIVGSDALLELRCRHREGLLLRVLQELHQEPRLVVTSVQASSAGDVLRAELRAKVKEVNGRRSSITELKRAIHRIVSSE